MASTNSDNIQPGLEVNHPDTGLQVCYPPQQWSYPVPNEEGHKEVASHTSVRDTSIRLRNSNHLPRMRITKKNLLIGLVCVVILVGVIVGAVVGTQNSRSSSPATTSSPAEPGQDASPTMSSPAEMTGNPTSVWPGLAPTAVSWGYPHLEIFALTRNNTEAVYRKYRNTNSTSEDDFVPAGDDMELVGGNIDANSVPSVAVNQRISYYASNLTELFINTQGNCWGKLHENDQLWTPTGYDSWTACFQNLSVTGAPTFVQYSPEVEVVQAFYLATGASGDAGLAAYYTKWQPQDEWSTPTRIPGPDLQPMKPAAVAWSGNDSRVDLFAVSRNNSHLLHASWDAAAARWSAYEDLQGFATTPPVAVSRVPGLLDVFVRGGDAGLWHLAYNDSDGRWSGWTRLSAGSRIQGQPDAVSATPQSVDVFAWREDGSLLHKSYDGDAGRWSPAQDLEVLVDGGAAAGGRLSGPPTAVSDGPGSIHVFAYRDQRELLWKKMRSGYVGQVTNTTSLATVPYLTS
ncbi:fucose-specific lectin [Hypoxylon cercidicola]|nr:fucose-specific lectin [Hypoxylon cercidicola]